MKLEPSQRPSLHAQLIAIAITIVVILVVKALWASWAYDDWTCGFKHCVQVKQ